MNSPQSFASFRQNPEDIPPVLRHGLMNEEIYYYYRYLNWLLSQQKLLDSDGACVYPGIGADMSTIPTLFGSREIVGFDHAGLYKQSEWYDVGYLNRLKEELSEYTILKAIETIKSKCHGKGYDKKRNRGGYDTSDFVHNDNSHLLVIELLSLGIPLSKMQFENARDNGLQCIHISFKDKVHPDIYIYQADVLDDIYKESMEIVMKKHRPTYYIQKTGENIIEFDSFPLQYMTNNSDTGVIALGHNYRYTKTMPPVHLREALTQTDTSGKNNITNLSDTIGVMITENLSSLGEDMIYGNKNHYRWALDIYKKTINT